MTLPKNKICHFLHVLHPGDITEEEAETMAAVLQRAYDRKYTGVVDISSARRSGTLRR
ncbi:hypothetical protein ACGFK1_28795 [Mycobacterium sp. NPDC048908]|uniref:hypothetical protein n=1 Tax=Mycobacterium sp. NPDC048908 TaxID=3364292 RepID=UPI00371178CE